MSQFVRNLLRGLRVFRNTPVWSTTIVLTLALGIGANTAVFSVMNAVLLRGLPVVNPKRIFYVHLIGSEEQPAGAESTGDSNRSFSMPVFSALRSRKDVFDALIAYVPLAFGETAVQVNGSPLALKGEEVSGNFFDGLTVRVALGRVLVPEDERDHTSTMVISYAFWTREFSRKSSALGQTVSVKGIPFTIVGVAARGFFGVDAGSSVDFWIPLQSRPELNAWGVSTSYGALYSSPNWWCLQVMARLRSGITPEKAQSATSGTLLSAAQIGLGTIHAPWKALLILDPAEGMQGYKEQYGAQVKILMGLVILVLLIAITNVILMITARNDARIGDFGMRLALGASRNQLLNQLLAESTLLVLFGAFLGWLFALMATRSLAPLAQIETGLSPDSTVLCFTFIISVVAILVFAIVPLHSIDTRVVGSIIGASARQSTDSRGRKITGNLLMVVQVAACLFLLVTASLLLRTLNRYRSEPLGMQADRLLFFGLSPQHIAKPSDADSFYLALVNRIREVPGVVNATILENRPGSGWSDNNALTIDNVQQRGVLLRSNSVGAHYFEVVGTPLLQGRDIGDQDGLGTLPVAVINQTLALRYFPYANPLGHYLGSGKSQRTIVGVVADSRYSSVDEVPMPMAYYAASQAGIANAQITVRATREPLALIPSVRDAVHSLSPTLPLEDPMVLSKQFALGYAQPTMFAALGTFFGSLAALLVAVGLYGTLSYRAGRRTSEFGVRMALGAKRGQVIWLVLKEGIIASTLGIAVGLMLIFGSTSLLNSMLWHVSPVDLTSLVLGIVGIFFIVALASLIPARRASSINPAEAIRGE